MKIVIDTGHPVTTKAAEVWKLRHQMNILVEECSEVIKAVAKLNRYLDDGGTPDLKHFPNELSEHLAEEMGDVNVSSMSVINLLGCQESVRSSMQHKIERLRKRMEENCGIIICDKSRSVYTKESNNG